MLTPLEAVDSLMAQTYEHLEEDPSVGGIITVQESLGIDPTTTQPAVEKMMAMIAAGMPLDAALLGAFVAGALWRRAQE